LDKDTAFVGSTSCPSTVPGPEAAVHIFRLKARKWREGKQILPINAYITSFGGFSIAIFKTKAIMRTPAYNQTGADHSCAETRNSKWGRTTFNTAGQMPGGPAPSFFAVFSEIVWSHFVREVH